MLYTDHGNLIIISTRSQATGCMLVVKKNRARDTNNTVLFKIKFYTYSPQIIKIVFLLNNI